MNAYQYVVVNEYGTMLPETAAWSAEQCEHTFSRLHQYTLEQVGCCVVRLAVELIKHRPGNWYKAPKAEVENG